MAVSLSSICHYVNVISNFFLQLLVYYILTSINSMMDVSLRQHAQVFHNVAQSLVDGVEAFFPNAGIGQIPAAEIVCALMVLLVVYFFVGILYQFLPVFCACLFALVVYNNFGRMFDFVGGRP